MKWKRMRILVSLFGSSNTSEPIVSVLLRLIDVMGIVKDTGDVGEIITKTTQRPVSLSPAQRKSNATVFIVSGRSLCNIFDVDKKEGTYNLRSERVRSPSHSLGSSCGVVRWERFSGCSSERSARE